MALLQLLDLVSATATLSVTLLSAALCQTLGRERASAGNSLAAFFVCLAAGALVSLLIAAANPAVTPEQLRWLRLLNLPTAYLLGPLLYRYTRTLLAGSGAMPPLRHTVHALPGALALLYALVNLAWGIDATAWGGALHRVVYHAWVVQGVGYLAAAAWLAQRARPALEQVSSDDANLRLAWLRVVTAVFGALWLAYGAERAVLALTDWVAPPALAALDWLTLLAVNFLAWSGLRQRALMPAALATGFAAAPVPPAETASRYARSGLTPAELAQIAADLERAVVDAQLHADSSLDLQTLSDRSGWPPSYISQALNQSLGRNFFEFVNGFRVAAAERCLADPADPRSVLDIAMACGFGSKSTFNTVFKRMTGVTPSEFRRRRSAPVAR